VTEARHGTNWERMRECAAQADKFLRDAGWSEGKRYGDVTFMGSQNHYSAEYERCFVLASFQDRTAKGGPGFAPPSLYEELWDAFESRELASCTPGLTYADNQGRNIVCTIQEKDSRFNCNVCRQFIDQRMNR
jgi:hypothetical protein